ncbi:response regulator [Paenibacillus sp. NPDC058071]|uniref:response regulator n=1 Tax=Paenibacillus sp. NPDC058071 TaxID=3346326 RepID=UPI0036D982F7
MLRVMIVDDEELSIKRLKRLLTESGRLESCHTFINPVEAYVFAEENAIDVAFLDISMPEINGMSLSIMLKKINPSIHIVFATGYDHYAVQAFDVNALDYLLKPVTAHRLEQTLGKIPVRAATAREQASLHIRMFNGLHIYAESSSEPLKFRSPKTEELFAFLIYKRTASRDEIVETLWSDLEPKKAWKNLNSTLYYLRRAISDSGAGLSIHSTREEIKLTESDVDCDLYLFERLLKEIRQAPMDSAGQITQAEALYTGALLKGKAYDWSVDKARGLERHYIELMEIAASYELAGRQPQNALHYFGEIVRLDPIREDIYFEMIKLLSELGRSHEAVRSYRRMEEHLQLELGIKPDRRLTEFVERLYTGLAEQ